jgi:hypothetical protein
MKGRFPYGNGSNTTSSYNDINGVGSYGDVYFVDSNGGGSADSNAGTKRNPCTTIQSAHDQASAANGDTIVMAPGHAETIATAGGIALTKAGIRYVGTGMGSEKTTISFSATGSTLTQTGANCVYENIRFVGAKDGLVAPFTISVANTTFINCEFIDTTTLNTLHWLTVTAAGTELSLIDCHNKGTDTAGNTAFITLAAVEDVKIINLKSQGDFSAANIDCSAAVIDIQIDRCFLENLNAVDVNIEGFAASTGWIANCKCEIATDAQVTWINTPGEISLYENYGVNEAGETGKLIGTVSA